MTRKHALFVLAFALLAPLASAQMATIDDIRLSPTATVHLVFVTSGIKPSDQSTATFVFGDSATLKDARWGIPAAYIPTPGLSMSGQGVDSSLIKGTRLGGIASLDTVSVEVGTYPLEDGTFSLDALADYEFEGRDGTLYWLGELDGAVLDWANKGTVFDGTVERTSGWDPQVMRFPLRAKAPRIDAPLIGTYRGTPWARAYNGSSDGISCGDVLNPTGSFSYLVDFYAEAPPASSPVVQSLVDKAKHGVTYDATTAASPVAKFSVVKGGVTTTASVAVPAYHRFYTAVATYTSSTGGLSIRLDTGTAGTATTAAPGAIDTDTTPLRFGRNVAGAFYDGVIGRIARFDTALSSDEQRDYVGRVLVGDETGLVALWIGLLSAGGKLADSGPSYVPATATSPYDGTLTGTVEATTFEGGEDLAGTAKRILIGGYRNVRGIPVYPILKIFQFSSEPIHIPNFSTIRDAGTAVAMDAIKNRIYDFFADAVTATKFNLFPYYGAVRLASKNDFGDVTATVSGWCVQSATFESNGRNVHKPARGLYLNSGYVDLGSTITSTFSASFTVELRLFHGVPSGSEHHFFKVNSGAGDAKLDILWTVNNVLSFQYSTAPGFAQSVAYSFPANSHRPFCIAFVVSISGGAVQSTEAYVDGVLVGSGGAMTGGVSPGSPSTYISSQTAGARFTGTVEDVRIWDSARTAAQIRADLYADTPSTTPTHWYKQPLVRDPGTTWADSGSGTAANGTITNGTWAGGVPLSTTRGLVRGLLLSADVAEGSIDLSESWGISSAPLGDVITGPSREAGGEKSDSSIRVALSHVLDALGCALSYNRSTAKWVLRQVTDPSTATATATLDEWQFLETPTVENEVKPPQRILQGYAPVDLVQRDSDLVQTADAALRALVSKPFRYFDKSAASPTVYPLEDNPLQIDSRIFSLVDARVEAIREVTVIGTKRRVWKGTLDGGPWESLTPGQVIQVNHARMPGGGGKFVILQLVDPARVGFATIYFWG